MGYHTRPPALRLPARRRLGFGLAFCCSGLILGLLSGTARAQVSSVSVVQKYTKGAAGLTPEPGVTVFYSLAAPSPVTITLRRHSAAHGQHPGTLFPGVPVKTVKLPKQAKGTRMYAWSGMLDSGAEVTAPVPQPDGSVRELPVNVFTVEVQAAKGPAGVLTFSRATSATAPALQLVPQTAANVVTLGQPLSIGLCVTNLTGAAKTLPVTYACATSVGSLLKEAKTTIAVPSLRRVSTALSLGAPSIPGMLRISATVTDGAPVSLVTFGGTVPLHFSPSTSETPFGVVGVRDLGVLRSLGAKWWLGEWPWPADRTGADAAGAAAATAPRLAARQVDSMDSPGGFLAEAQRNGLSVGGSVPPGIFGGMTEEGFGAYLSFMQQVMKAYIRQAGLWQLPSSGEPAPDDYVKRLRSFYAAAKSIHKDTPAILDAGNDVDQARLLAEAGAGLYTDALVLQAIHPAPATQPQQTLSLSALLALRDARYPGKEIWSTARGSVVKAGKPEDANALVKTIVTHIAAGVDRVFWQGEPDLLQPDGSPTAAFFGYSTLTHFLGGAEYVGSLDWPEGAHGYVFQKRGQPILVAWADSGVKAVPVPSVAPNSLVARDPFYTRANVGRVSGNKVGLTSTPVFLEGIQMSLWSEARLREATARLTRIQEAAALAKIEVPSLSAQGVTEETIGKLFESGLARYKASEGSRAPALSYLYHVCRLADQVALEAGMTEKATKITSDKALDVANHAVADLRLELTRQEGVAGYLRDLRTLLRQAERPNYLARVALKQGDLALAQSRAQQTTQFCKALVELVPVETVWYPSQELTASTASR